MHVTIKQDSERLLDMLRLYIVLSTPECAENPIKIASGKHRECLWWSRLFFRLAEACKQRLYW